MRTSSLSGAQYLSEGFHLIWQPGIKRFVFIPLAINLIILSIATVYAFQRLTVWYDSLNSSDNSIVQWFIENLDWLLWPLIVIGVFAVVFFIFAFLANWIAAPFNGLLSEAVERKLAGSTYNEPVFTWKHFLAEVPRLFGREWRKLVYYIPRAIGCLLLFFIAAPIVPFVWFLFNAWMTGIQYIDYPMDNHRRPFNETLHRIRQRKSASFSFGTVVMLFTMIPLVNIFIMPVAVAGATALWYDNYRE